LPSSTVTARREVVHRPVAVLLAVEEPARSTASTLSVGHDALDERQHDVVRQRDARGASGAAQQPLDRLAPVRRPRRDLAGRAIARRTSSSGAPVGTSAIPRITARRSS
jgi:hypothetical protein